MRLLGAVLGSSLMSSGVENLERIARNTATDSSGTSTKPPKASTSETAALSHPVNGKRVLDILNGAPRPRMIGALRSCKRHFRGGAITNNMKPAGGNAAVVDDPKRAMLMEHAMSLFEVIVESSVEGVRKPDPAIYRIACARLGVEPARTVFLDDLGINLKPARAMGMHTIKVLNEDQALAELSEVTGLRFK